VGYVGSSTNTGGPALPLCCSSLCSLLCVLFVVVCFPRVDVHRYYRDKQRATAEKMDRYYEDDDIDSQGSILTVRSGDSSSNEESSSSSSDEDAEEFRIEWQRMKDNDPNLTSIELHGDEEEHVENMTENDWEQFGHDVANNTHLKYLTLCDGALTEQKMLSLFGGLTGSNSIQEICLLTNGFGVEGVRSMVPFLQNAGNLKNLDVSCNNIGSEGFALLWRTLCNRPIKQLYCSYCGIESIEIDDDHIPQELFLNGNRIRADGCRELTKLLQRRVSTLTILCLRSNMIDDEGVKILANALQSNTSLEILALEYNESISNEGRKCLLKLVNDLSSIKATLQSNHTLQKIFLSHNYEETQQQINAATLINETNKRNPDAAGREKVIHAQLHSVTRAKVAHLQGVAHRSVYNDIDPLHLPEILSLVDQKHGQRELYVALKSSIVTLFSTVDEKKCIEQEREYHATKEAEHRAKKEELDAKLAAMEGVQGNDVDGVSERSNKRRRTWFWGLWGG
jgi:hypothetical protein